MQSQLDPLSGLVPGDHACTVEGTPLSDFVTDGLLFGDRVAYVAGEPARRQLCRQLHRRGHDVALLARTGRLLMLDTDQVYGPAGSFDSQATVAGFESQVAAARQDGFRTLRSAGGPSPAQLAAIELVELVSYELDCDRMAARSGVIGLCEYPAGDEDLLRHVGVAHNRRLVPLALDPGFTVDLRAAGEVRIIGEIDAFAAGELGIGLAGVAGLDVSAERLDVSELQFIDSAGMRALGRWLCSLAGPQPAAVQVFGASASFRRTWDLMDLGPVAWVGLAA